MSLILKKILFILLITLLEVLGLILIAYGIFSLSTAKPDELYPGRIFIFIGSITMIMAVFGFLAAISESSVRLLMYLGALALMIRIKMLLIDTASEMKDQVKEEIRKVSAFKPILVPDPTELSNAVILIQWLGVIKTVCYLIILVEVVGAAFAVLLYRSIKRSRLAEIPVSSS